MIALDREKRKRGFVGRLMGLDVGVLPSLSGYVSTLQPIGWWRYGQGITVASGGVSRWADASGNGNDLIQATPSFRPSLQSDGSMLFDGIAQFLRTAAFSVKQPTTLYLLLKQVSWSNSARIVEAISSPFANTLRQQVSSPTLGIGVGVATSSALDIGVYGALCAVHTTPAVIFQINNNSPATASISVNDWDGITLGCSRLTTLFANVQVKELLFYPAAHDAIQRALVMRYLQILGQIPL